MSNVDTEDFRLDAAHVFLDWRTIQRLEPVSLTPVETLLTTLSEHYSMRNNRSIGYASDVSVSTVASCHHIRIHAVFVRRCW